MYRNMNNTVEVQKCIRKFIVLFESTTFLIIRRKLGRFFVGLLGELKTLRFFFWNFLTFNKKKSKKIVAPQETRWTSPTFRAAPRISHKAFKRILIWLLKCLPQFSATITKLLHQPGCQPLLNSLETKPTSRASYKLRHSTSEMRMGQLE